MHISLCKRDKCSRGKTILSHYLTLGYRDRRQHQLLNSTQVSYYGFKTEKSHLCCKRAWVRYRISELVLGYLIVYHCKKQSSHLFHLFPFNSPKHQQVQSSYAVVVLSAHIFFSRPKL